MTGSDIDGGAPPWKDERMTQTEQQIEAMRNAIIGGGEWRPLFDKMLLDAELEAKRKAELKYDLLRIDVQQAQYALAMMVPTRGMDGTLGQAVMVVCNALSAARAENRALMDDAARLGDMFSAEQESRRRLRNRHVANSRRAE